MFCRFSLFALSLASAVTIAESLRRIEKFQVFVHLAQGFGPIAACICQLRRPTDLSIIVGSEE